MMGAVLGRGAVRQVGETVGGIAEIIVGNRAERDAAAAATGQAALGELSAEFARAPSGRWDGFVDGLNRLPRPLLALGTLGLFTYAMVEPNGFGVRMQGLGLVPEPLWWLLGAIVSFYFGARELHHQRSRSSRLGGLVAARAMAVSAEETADDEAAPVATLAALPAARVADPEYNAAVEEWRALGRR